MSEYSDILRAVAAGDRVSERDFDLIFPKAARKFARAEWTPLVAAVRAAAMLVDRPGVRVLDVGCGAGKFCVIGSLTTKGQFTGIDTDEELVDIARELASAAKLPRLTFRYGDALTLDWTKFDALYFFNPFANSAGDEAEFMATIGRVSAKLAAMPSGTRVVTYHGYGGQMPPCYREEAAEVVGPGVLQLWVST